MIVPSLTRGGIAMFLRRFQRRKNGKVHSYFALVESYRTAKGSRQRIVSYLGELEPDEESGWAKLGRGLDGKPPRTLGEIGDTLHLTRERIRQLEKEAIRVLRIRMRHLSGGRGTSRRTPACAVRHATAEQG